MSGLYQDPPEVAAARANPSFAVRALEIVPFVGSCGTCGEEATYVNTLVECLDLTRPWANGKALTTLEVDCLACDAVGEMAA